MFNVINLIIVLILILFISGFAGYAVLKGKSRNLISTNIIAGLLIYTIDNYLFKNLTYSIVIQLAFGLFGIILFFKGRKQFDFLNRFHLFISVPLFFIFIYVFTRLAVLFPVRIPHQISATAAVIMIQPIEFDGLKFQVLRNPLKTLSNIPAASSHNTMNSESDTDAIPAING